LVAGSLHFDATLGGFFRQKGYRGQYSLPCPCPQTPGYWKNHAEAWPVSSLILGSQTSSKPELLQILKSSVAKDASLILAHQLIAAKLNVGNGSDPAPVSPAIAQADNLLSGLAGKLPYNVKASSSLGQSMVNTAAVLDADGTLLGKYRKNHIPHTSGFWEKYFFKPGNLGYPVFQTRYGKVGVYICYDRHFPEGARLLGLNGAEIVFNPSATVAGLSQYLWKLEQPAHAVANGYYMGCINRVGTEAPWNIGKFYGTSYFVNPRGQILAEASEDKDELVVAELDLGMIEEVRRIWQFFRDRRPESYDALVQV